MELEKVIRTYVGGIDKSRPSPFEYFTVMYYYKSCLINNGDNKELLAYLKDWLESIPSMYLCPNVLRLYYRFRPLEALAVLIGGYLTYTDLRYLVIELLLVFFVLFKEPFRCYINNSDETYVLYSTSKLIYIDSLVMFFRVSKEFRRNYKHAIPFSKKWYNAVGDMVALQEYLYLEMGEEYWLKKGFLGAKGRGIKNN